MTSENGNRRGLLGGLLTRVLGPLYYWAGLYDAHRRPDHLRLKTTAAFVTAIGVTISLSVHLFSDHADHTAGDLPAPELYTLFGFVVLMLFASYGIVGLTIWARIKRSDGSLDETGFKAREADAVALAKEQPPTKL